MREPEAGELRDSGGYPAGLRASELPPERLAAVARDRRALRALAKVLSDARAHDGVGARGAGAVGVDGMAGRPGGGARVPGGRGPLSGRVDRLGPAGAQIDGWWWPESSATIPVTVANGLQQDLIVVELRVLSSRPERARAVDRAVGRTGVAGGEPHGTGPGERARERAGAAHRPALHQRRRAPWGAPMTFTADVRSVPSGAVAFVAAGWG